VSVTHASLIVDAVRAEKRARLASRHLLREWEKLSNAERIRFIEIEERSSDSRSAAIEKLQLKKTTAGRAADLYANNGGAK